MAHHKLASAALDMAGGIGGMAQGLMGQAGHVPMSTDAPASHISADDAPAGHISRDDTSNLSVIGVGLSAICLLIPIALSLRLSLGLHYTLTVSALSVPSVLVPDLPVADLNIPGILEYAIVGTLPIATRYCRGMRRLGSVPVAQQSLGLHEKKGWAGWACKNSWAGSVKSVALRGCLGLNCHIVIFVMTGLEVEANNPAAP
eukprot:1159425-Pelagomonas_calceolata.AAC.9